VFISIVHTRHCVESTAAQYAGNFGLLHDQKLLNTVLTRAKSFVAVVGDPVALCSLGSCSEIWRTYLKRCLRLQSVRPSQLSLKDVYNQSQELLRMNDTSFSEWSTDFSLAADEIIQRLGIKDESEPTTSNTSLTYRYADAETEYETDDTDESDESDEEFEDVAAEDNTQDVRQDDISVLESLLITQRDIYRRCKLDIRLAHLAHAVVCDDRSQVIVINGRKNFGNALHGDKVVVRITESNQRICDDDIDGGSTDDDNNAAESVAEDADDWVVGEVVGILQPAFSLIDRTFVCRKDDRPNYCKLMIPLNFRLPKIKVSFCKRHTDTQQTDVVCVLKKKNQWKHFRVSSRTHHLKVKVLNLSTRSCRSCY